MNFLETFLSLFDLCQTYAIKIILFNVEMKSFKKFILHNVAVS